MGPLPARTERDPAPRSSTRAERVLSLSRPRSLSLSLSLSLALAVALALVGLAADHASPAEVPHLSGPILTLPRSAAMATAPSVAWENLSLHATGGPTPRCCSASAYDVVDQEWVLYGGANGCGNCNDTWVEANGTWTNITATAGPAPPGRSWATMAYDPVSEDLVLFGGLLASPNASVAFAAQDTWTFQGGRWTPQAPLQSPPGRWAAGMDFDPTLGAVVLFGGFSPSGGFLSDTWAYANGSWAPLFSSVSPPPRWAPALTFDYADQGLLLFGGLGENGSVLNDTWLMTGTQWAPVPPGVAPPAREKAVMAFDPSLDRVVLFGGDVCASPCLPSSVVQYFNDTWTFTDGYWQDLTGSAGGAPMARCCSSVAYDPYRAALLLTVGAGALGAEPVGTWALEAPPSGTLDLTVATAVPNPVLVGQPTTLVVGIAGTAGRPTYLLAQLPWPCLPEALPEAVCAPSDPGTYGLSMEVRDPSGGIVSVSIVLSVLPSEGNASAPVPSPLAADASSITFGAGVAILLVGAALFVRRPGRLLGASSKRGGGPRREGRAEGLTPERSAGSSPAGSPSGGTGGRAG